MDIVINVLHVSTVYFRFIDITLMAFYRSVFPSIGFRVVHFYEQKIILVTAQRRQVDVWVSPSLFRSKRIFRHAEKCLFDVEGDHLNDHTNQNPPDCSYKDSFVQLGLFF